MSDLFRDYAKRFLICILGLMLCGFSTYLGAKAGSAGTNGWITLAVGMSALTKFSLGQSTFMISLVVLTFDIVLKGKFGFGTVLNTILISVFADFFSKLFAAVPDPPNVFVGLVISLIAQLAMSFGLVIYMSPGLGAGPRNTLMLIIGKRFSKYPIGTINFGTELMAMLIGVLLGAPFGIGTVFSIALQSTFLEFACRVCKFEPRNVRHESIKETLLKF